MSDYLLVCGNFLHLVLSILLMIPLNNLSGSCRKYGSFLPAKCGVALSISEAGQVDVLCVFHVWGFRCM